MIVINRKSIISNPRSPRIPAGTTVVKQGSSSAAVYYPATPIVKENDTTLLLDTNVFSAIRARREIKKAIQVEQNESGETIALMRNETEDSVIISIKLEDITSDTINSGHIAIKTNDAGELYGEQIWVEN